MDPAHCEKLTKHRPALVQDMHPANVVDHLISSGILLHSHEEQIMSKSSSSDRNRELLRILLTRGSSAFGKFVDALKSTQQLTLVNLLATGNDISLTIINNKTFVLKFEWEISPSQMQKIKSGRDVTRPEWIKAQIDDSTEIGWVTSAKTVPEEDPDDLLVYIRYAEGPPKIRALTKITAFVENCLIDSTDDYSNGGEQYEIGDNSVVIGYRVASVSAIEEESRESQNVRLIYEMKLTL